EFSNFVVSPERNSLVVLDKTGDIFEMSIADGAWKALRPNYPLTGQPDPEYVDIAPAAAGKVYVLDPERNQIWKFPAARGSDRLFAEVLPWRLKAGDANVTDALAIAFDSHAYVLRHSGIITKYGDRTAAGPARSLPFYWRRPKDARPSR